MDDQADLSGIERRIRATRAVRRIMHAILVASRVQHGRAEALSIESTIYYQWLDEAITRLAGPAAQPEGSALRVVFGPERGLCGGLLSAVSASVRPSTSYALVGSRLLADHTLACASEFSIPGVSSPAEFTEKATEVAALILQHAHGRSVELIFPVTPGGALHSELLLAGRRLLPASSVDTYSPHGELLSAMIAQAFSGRISHALAQTLQAELAARVMLAHRARTNCDERLRQLEDEWRIVQKDQITTELGELIGARAAPRR